MTWKELLDLVLRVVPIIGGLIWAVIKIGSMLDTKLKAQEQSWTRLLTELKTEFQKHIDDLWSSQTRQDTKFDSLSRDHYRLEGKLGVTDRDHSAVRE